MTSTTNHHERAAAATATRMFHQPPPPPHPFPHLALQQPQRHSGDPFVQPPMAGPSYIPNPQPPNPSPRDQVADIRAQLAAIQQQQPPPASKLGVVLQLHETLLRLLDLDLDLVRVQVRVRVRVLLPVEVPVLVQGIVLY
ncbi:hypothetical protein K439DRAFT_1615778 [Ramaria rubella]|nr:hypothetical protein K439DRAFT_1615778 [Ramaria rubella]